MKWKLPVTPGMDGSSPETEGAETDCWRSSIGDDSGFTGVLKRVFTSSLILANDTPSYSPSFFNNPFKI